MKIHNGGSDMDNQLSISTGYTLPPTINSTRNPTCIYSKIKEKDICFKSSLTNQLFISFTSNDNGAGKGFSASIVFGKNWKMFLF